METRSKFGHWVHLFRIFSLTATLMPILMAFCLNVMWPVWTHQPSAIPFSVQILHLVVALISCGSLQICCNLLNTWGDFRSGVDTPERLPSRSELVKGVFTPQQVLGMAMLFFTVGSLAGAYLVFCCYTPSLLVYAILGIAGSVNYSTGIRFKYRGLGVPFVFFLMGIWLILAADLCFGGQLNTLLFSSVKGFFFALCTLLPISCLVSNIMHANDMRDIEDDHAAGIRTCATLLGTRGAAFLFAAFHLLPIIGVLGMLILWPSVTQCSIQAKCMFLVLPLLLLPLSLKVLAEAKRGLPVVPHQKSWAGLLAQTARLHLLTGLLQSISFLLIR